MTQTSPLRWALDMPIPSDLARMILVEIADSVISPMRNDMFKDGPFRECKVRSHLGVYYGSMERLDERLQQSESTRKRGVRVLRACGVLLDADKKIGEMKVPQRNRQPLVVELNDRIDVKDARWWLPTAYEAVAALLGSKKDRENSPYDTVEDAVADLVPREIFQAEWYYPSKTDTTLVPEPTVVELPARSARTAPTPEAQEVLDAWDKAEKARSQAEPRDHPAANTGSWEWRRTNWSFDDATPVETKKRKNNYSKGAWLLADEWMLKQKHPPEGNDGGHAMRAKIAQVAYSMIGEVSVEEMRTLLDQFVDNPPDVEWKVRQVLTKMRNGGVKTQSAAVAANAGAAHETSPILTADEAAERARRRRQQRMSEPPKEATS